MKKLTVREYAIEKGISETAVRKQINRNQLRTTHEIINNRKTLLIIVEDGLEPSKPNHSSLPPYGSEPYKDVEIVNETTGFQIVSMEQSSFDNLIQSFKEISTNQIETIEGVLKATQTELFETKAELKKSFEENKNLILQSAQSETNSKIIEVKNLELQNELEKLTNIIRQHEEELKLIKDENSHYKAEIEKMQTQLTLKQSSFWNKKL